MTKVVLAVDGGATKTAVKVLDGERELMSITGSGSNYQAIGEEKVTAELSRLLSQVAQLSVTVDAAVFAIAGIDTKQDLVTVRKIVADSIAASGITVDTYVVENDVEAAMRGLCGDKPGALLISGTGAIGYSFDGERVYRAGGWGHRVGDEGSGYWIGQAVVQAVFKSMDGRGAATVLSEYVLTSKGFADTDELMNWLYRGDYRNADLAGFGSLLQQAVESGDAVAVQIAELAAEELTSLACALLKPFHGHLDNTFTFYLNGGILKNNAYIYDRFVQGLQNEAPRITITLCEQKPIDAIIARANTI